MLKQNQIVLFILFSCKVLCLNTEENKVFNLSKSKELYKRPSDDYEIENDEPKISRVLRVDSNNEQKGDKFLKNLAEQSQIFYYLYQHAGSVISKSSKKSKFISNGIVKLKCEDPSSSVLHNAYLRINTLFRESDALIQLPVIEEMFKNLTVSMRDINESLLPHFGNDKCADNNKNFSVDSESSLCPWHTKIEIRNDRYPYSVTRIKCNCKSCFKNFPLIESAYIGYDEKFHCKEQMSLKPALMRTNKCTNGYYEWIPVLESLPTHCICVSMRQSKNIMSLK